MPHISVKMLQGRSEAQKAEHRDERHGRTRTGTERLPDFLTGSVRCKGRAYTKVGKLVLPHVVEHEIHKRRIVRSVLQNLPEIFRIGGLSAQRTVEYPSGLKRRKAEQYLKRVEHGIGCTEIVDFSLIERLHEHSRETRAGGTAAPAGSHPSVFLFLMA